MKQDTLGSWKQAVTSADGVWMTRGYHSKNGTFSVRILMEHCYFKSTSGKSDDELYKGTSKSMEGFAACELMMQAKKEGMEIAVQWQDSDSSSSKTVKECFPNCKIMICGGHAAKNHLKALKKYSKFKFPSKDMIKAYEGCTVYADIFK